MGASLRSDHHFAKVLVASMAREDVTSADLSRRLNVSRATVYGWLNGSEPSDGNFKKLVRLFPDLSKFGDW